MCTVSVIASEGGYRLVTNRDVARSRAAARPPTRHEVAGVGWALWPTDPEGGGTWVGVNAAGVTLCLLNRNMEPEPEADPRWRSRGGLIPGLMGHGDAGSAIGALVASGDPACAPFRVVAVDLVEGGATGRGVRAIEAVYELGGVRVVEHPSGRGFAPGCWVSSGLGDSKVACRLALFGAMVGGDPTAAAQDAFHRHAWAGRREVSCLMAREAARTVSITTVEVGRGVEPVMAYEAVAEV